MFYMSPMIIGDPYYESSGKRMKISLQTSGRRKYRFQPEAPDSDQSKKINNAAVIASLLDLDIPFPKFLPRRMHVDFLNVENYFGTLHQGPNTATTEKDIDEWGFPGRMRLNTRKAEQHYQEI
jgi:hypothetical protein